METGRRGIGQTHAPVVRAAPCGWPGASVGALSFWSYCHLRHPCPIPICQAPEPWCQGAKVFAEWLTLVSEAVSPLGNFTRLRACCPQWGAEANIDIRGKTPT